MAKHRSHCKRNVREIERTKMYVRYHQNPTQPGSEGNASPNSSVRGSVPPPMSRGVDSRSLKPSSLQSGSKDGWNRWRDQESPCVNDFTRCFCAGTSRRTAFKALSSSSGASRVYSQVKGQAATTWHPNLALAE